MLFRPCNMFCTFTLALSAVRVQCPTWLFVVHYYYYYTIWMSLVTGISPGTSLESAVIPTAHASSFTLMYFPYYV